MYFNTGDMRLRWRHSYQHHHCLPSLLRNPGYFVLVWMRTVGGDAVDIYIYQGKVCERQSLEDDTTSWMVSNAFCLFSLAGNSKYHFNAHMNAHFEHACPQCDYTSRTEGRLKRHIKDFHSDTPPNNFSGSRMLSSSPSSFAPMKREPGRPKLFRCRHCDFSSPTKVCQRQKTGKSLRTVLV